MRAKSVVLSPYGLGHLGDALCLSALPRRLVQELGLTVRIERSVTNLAVFKNNPYIAGFSRIKTHWKAAAPGHLIQRHLRAYGLSSELISQPEIYLTDEEKCWAAEIRNSWRSHDKPACILSCQAVSDDAQMKSVNWKMIGEHLQNYCTVIQPLVIKSTGGSSKAKRKSANAPTSATAYVINGAIHYHNLSTRQYFALFSVADLFCGGTSGGSHLAAAFDLPSLIITWRDLMKGFTFPDQVPTIEKTTFLYPQHHFLCRESISFRTKAQFDRVLRSVLREVHDADYKTRRLASVIAPPPVFIMKRFSQIWSNKRILRVPAL